MAKPYKEGTTWSLRLRRKDGEIYQSGFATEADAKSALAQIDSGMKSQRNIFGDGPHKTTLAKAMQDFGLQKLSHLKGARQDAGRLNKFIRFAGLATLQLTSAAGQARHTVTLKQEHGKRDIPNSLKDNRNALLQKSSESDKLRQQLARMKMADIASHHIQALINAMDCEGYKGATMNQELANIKRVFNHAYQIWGWHFLRHNPCSAVVIHKKADSRERVISQAEWEDLIVALQNYGNPYVLPALGLLLETAMRASEVLVQATWEDVAWDRNTLYLKDAKAGARTVPLGPVAMEILERLKSGLDFVDPKARILNLSYEALKKAWTVACKECGITDCKLHDIRHTATTRYAYEFYGNPAFLKVITGHKTGSQLQRYINIKAADVASLMHQRGLSQALAPAGLNLDKLNDGHPAKPKPSMAIDLNRLPANVVPLRNPRAA